MTESVNSYLISLMVWDEVLSRSRMYFSAFLMPGSAGAVQAVRRRVSAAMGRIKRFIGQFVFDFDNLFPIMVICFRVW